ncbi:MAG: GNAT family N-acetyltransferase, partial [Candidatus Gracilibacteria bacterium]
MKIIKINPFEQPQMVGAIASVYQQSFGGEPWNEGYLCPLCESVFASTPTLSTCPKCTEQSLSVLVVEYWPISKVVSDFYREMKNPNPICTVAQSDDGVIGFAWGYQVSAGSDLDKYLDAPDLRQSLRGDFFYLDECALTPFHQGRGVGKLLVKQIFREQKQGRILLRTMNDSRMYNL